VSLFDAEIVAQSGLMCSSVIRREMECTSCWWKRVGRVWAFGDRYYTIWRSETITLGTEWFL